LGEFSVANIKYSELIDEVLPALGADPSDPVTENAIKRAVIEFCASSWIWKYLPDPLSVTANEAYYDLEPLSGTDIVTIMDVLHNNVPLTPKTTTQLDHEIPGWRTTQATPKYYTQVDTEQLILAPIPPDNLANGLTMTLVLQPSQSASGFPKWIYNQYLYSLADGAISKLMLMPGKPWSDAATGLDRRTRFEQAIANARNSSVSALSRAAGRVAYQH
jgi:hypothetical protein